MERFETQLEISGQIATLTLNRPDKLNAWTATMEREVHAALAEAEADSSVRAVILTGAGRGFCAGADMSLLKDLAERGAASLSPGQISAPLLPALSKPVVAAVNGPAVGLGFVLALQCDLRFASSAALFSTAFARRGLVAEYGVAWRLPRTVGLPNALDLLLSARNIDSAEALRMGLVNAVFPADTFAAQVREYVRGLVTLCSPRSMRVIKEQVYQGIAQTKEEASELAQREVFASLASDDFKEGVAHFREKRPPNFTGN